MPFRSRNLTARFKLLCGVGALMAAGAASSFAQAEAPFDGPKLRKGLWRFDRTLEYHDARIVTRHGEVTRCVDPTNAMKGTFLSPDIGNCRSAKPERIANRYIFENRCDYMGPVRTDITVHSENSYIELNIPKAGSYLVDKVVARRIGDCDPSE